MKVNVSFVLPAYKRKYLHEAIASILAQTYRDFELAVVDDCSPEDLKSVVDEFHDERLTYHRNETNIGGKDLVAAWNAALGFASGEYVVLASDDDLYHPDFLGELLRLAEKYPSVNAFHCRMAVIDNAGRWTDVAEPRPEFETELELLYHLGALGYRQVISDFMYRRSELLRRGGYVSRPRAWTADESTALMMAKDNGVVCSSRILFRWRSSGINISTLFHDAAEKVTANEQFRVFLHRYLSDAKSKGENDDEYRLLCQSKLSDAVNGRNRFVLNQTGFWLWLKVMRTVDMDAVCKREMIKDRVRRMLSPGRVYVCFRSFARKLFGV